MNIPKIRESPPPTNVVNSGNSNKARTNFPPTTRMPFPVETNMANSINSKKANTNTQLTTRASPVPNEVTQEEKQSLTAFFKKPNNSKAKNTNLMGFPRKFNAHLNEIIINQKKNNNKPPTSTNLLGFPQKNKSRKNRKNKSRKNRKNRKGKTRRS